MTTDSPHPTRADQPPLPRLEDFIDVVALDALIAAARLEDLGPGSRDITSELFIPADARADAVMRPRDAGVWCGGALLTAVARAYDNAIIVDDIEPDGALIQPGDVLARFRGPLRSLLAMERVALNFATHLSGIATYTHRFVDAVKDAVKDPVKDPVKEKPTVITDTRKTIPGLRSLAKYAVACGGGRSHRMGLHDAVLIKDNHLAAIPPSQLTDALRDMTNRARQTDPPPVFIEVEVDTLDQLRGVLPCGVDIILLDNMDTNMLAQAVAMRKELAPNVLLEASGGVSLDTVAAIARTGVDRIAIGAITHSAPALDIGLDL